MAIYHLEAKVVSRGAGRSAVAASAYMSCSRLYNDYDGIQHDYTKKQGLVWQQVFLPEYAPQEWQDREKLWNAVEENEKAKDSRLAREFIAALPRELDRQAQISLIQEYVQEQFVAEGMCADAAIHDTDGQNPHAHILLTVRPLDEQGRWQYKTEKEYLCVRNGEERGFTAAEFKTAQAEGWEKQYPYYVDKKKKEYLLPSEAEARGLVRADKHPKSTRYGRQNPISERWNSEEQLVSWRAAWADVSNRYARYLEIRKLLREKAKQKKDLTAELRMLNPLNLMRRAEIKKALATLTEDMEELRSEMDMLIAGFGKGDPDGMKEVKQQLDALNANKTGLEDVAAKAADALDAEVQKYHALQEQSEAVDAEELHTARMELRGNMTAEVREKIKDTFGKHYDADRFRQADREVSELLGEPHPQKDRSIVRKLKEPQEQSVVQTRKHNNEMEL